MLVHLRDLAALVHVERAVRDIQQLDALDLAHGLDDEAPVLLARGVDRDVAHELAAAGLHDVDGADGSAGLADGGGDLAKHARLVVELDAQRQAV
jgi:hypothetical protein